MTPEATYSCEQAIIAIEDETCAGTIVFRLAQIDAKRWRDCQLQGADLDVIAKFTSVQIGKGEHLDSFSKLRIGSDALKELVWNVHGSYGQDASATRDENAFVAIAIPVAMPHTS